jgi:hypothetical protein
MYLMVFFMILKIFPNHFVELNQKNHLTWQKELL